MGLSSVLGGACGWNLRLCKPAPPPGRRLQSVHISHDGLLRLCKFLPENRPCLDIRSTHVSKSLKVSVENDHFLLPFYFNVLVSTVTYTYV
jgi:hypothetical protein